MILLGKIRVLIAKPGLDGHSNGAEQIAVRARDAGFEVIYQGIRLTPDQIVSAAVAEDVQVVGLSILSGSHMELVPDIVRGLKDAGLDDVPVVVGGIIPEGDAATLRAAGVADSAAESFVFGFKCVVHRAYVNRTPFFMAKRPNRNREKFKT